MSDNPFQSPQTTDAPIMGMLTSNRGELKAIAQYQKGLLYCILLYIGAIVARAIVPAAAVLPVVIVGGLAALVGAICVFLLAMRVYGMIIGILLGLLCLVPLLGLLVLLLINVKATKILQQNGIEVGLLGAKS